MQARLGGMVRAEDSDERVELVVVRLDVVVGNGPVVAEAVDALVLEIVRTEAQGDAAPVIGPAAERARAKPAPGATADVVRFAVDVPTANAAVIGAERFLV